MSILAKHRKLIGLLVFLGLALATVQFSGLKENFSVQNLQRIVLENKLGGVAVFTLLFVVGNFIQIPGLLFLAAAVLSLGRTIGGGVTFFAACVSCCVTFWTIRFVGGDALRNFDNKMAAKILARLDTQPIVSVFLLRTLFQTAPALNYALAMSGLKFRDYLLGTLLGLPLPILCYCLFFDFLRTAF